MKDKTVIEALAEVYPQLYLDPDRVDKETYRSVVLAGEMPERRSLAHFRQSLHAGQQRDRGDPRGQSAGGLNPGQGRL